MKRCGKCHSQCVCVNSSLSTKCFGITPVLLFREMADMLGSIMSMLPGMGTGGSGGIGGIIAAMGSGMSGSMGGMVGTLPGINSTGMIGFNHPAINHQVLLSFTV